MPSNHLILCHPLLLLPSIFPSIKVFSNESAFHIRWPNYWSFSFNISPSNEHPGLISFRMDWLDLPEVQGTLKSLLQHDSSKVLLALHKTHFLGSLMATVLLSPALSVLIFLVGLLIIPSYMINFLDYQNTEHSLVAPSLFSFLSLFLKDVMFSLLKKIYLFGCRS